MEKGIASGIYTSSVDGVVSGNLSGINTGYANGLYNENLIQDAIVREGLIFYVDAAQNLSYPRSGLVWRDLTVNADNGTLINSNPFSALNKGSIQHNGIGDRAIFNNLPPTPNLTVDIWVLPRGLNNFFTPITNQPFQTNTGFAIQQRNNNTFWVIIGTWGVVGDIISNIPFVFNEWINITMTYDGVTLSAYRNGIFFNRISCTRVLGQHILYIGAGSGGTREYYLGNISNVKIYDRALSAAEVMQNYLAVKGRFVM